jgi:hypothetical protein
MERIIGHVLRLLLLSANGFIPLVLSVNLTFLGSLAKSRWLSLKSCHCFLSVGCRSFPSFLCSSEACQLISLCHTRFWKVNRMRTMYVPRSKTHVHNNYIIGHHHTMLKVNSGKVLYYNKMSKTSTESIT